MAGYRKFLALNRVKHLQETAKNQLEKGFAKGLKKTQNGNK